MAHQNRGAINIAHVHRAQTTNAPPVNKVPDTLEDLLRKINFTKNPESEDIRMTEDQIWRLTSLTSKTDVPIFNLTNVSILYDIIGGILDFGFDNFMLFLEDIIQNDKIKFSEILFSSPIFDRERDLFFINLERSRRKVGTSKGLLKCPNCKSQSTESIEKQTRSADEPMTIISTCLECGKTWRIN